MALKQIIFNLPLLSFLERTSWMVVISIAACGQSKNARDNKEPPGAVAIKGSVLVKGLSYPWEILWGPDEHIWMTERGGKISRVNPATGAVIPVHTIAEVSSRGEGGLLGMVLHPQFSSKPYVYVGYNYYKGSDYSEKIVRFTYNGSTLVSPLTLLDNIEASSIHNGCRLLITPDLKLFITTGDASNQSRPQDPNSVNGKVLRINLDGSIPSDNPQPGKAYWSLGHRNAQGLVFANNIMYVSEHGPSTDDEINIIEKGKNYGWPEVNGFCNERGERSFCNTNNVKEPIKAWTPTTAACGMEYYKGNLIPQWKNSLIMAALKDERLHQMKLSENYTSISSTNEYFVNEYGRLRDVCISPAGKVYFCTSNGGKNDVIVEVKPD
jgi:aldose sugar dehydrogenase